MEYVLKRSSTLYSLIVTDTIVEVEDSFDELLGIVAELGQYLGELSEETVSEYLYLPQNMAEKTISKLYERGVLEEDGDGYAVVEEYDPTMITMEDTIDLRVQVIDEPVVLYQMNFPSPDIRHQVIPPTITGEDLEELLNTDNIVLGTEIIQYSEGGIEQQVTVKGGRITQYQTVRDNGYIRKLDPKRIKPHIKEPLLQLGRRDIKEHVRKIIENRLTWANITSLDVSDNLDVTCELEAKEESMEVINWMLSDDGDLRVDVGDNWRIDINVDYEVNGEFLKLLVDIADQLKDENLDDVLDKDDVYDVLDVRLTDELDRTLDVLWHVEGRHRIAARILYARLIEEDVLA